MNRITYNLNLETIYKINNIDHEPVMDSAVNEFNSDFTNNFFTQNYDIFSEGSFAGTNSFIDNGLKKSFLTNGPVLLMNQITNGYLSCNNFAGTVTGSSAFIFKRFQGKVSVQQEYPVTLSSTNYTAPIQGPIFVSTYLGSNHQFNISDLSSTNTSISQYSEYIPLSAVQNNNLSLKYFPLYTNFLVMKVVNGVISFITPVQSDLYNGIVKLNPTDITGSSGFYVFYATVPIFYLNPTTHLVIAENNGDTLNSIYLSSQTQSVLES